MPLSFACLNRNRHDRILHLRTEKRYNLYLISARQKLSLNQADQDEYRQASSGSAMMKVTIVRRVSSSYDNTSSSCLIVRVCGISVLHVCAVPSHYWYGLLTRTRDSSRALFFFSVLWSRQEPCEWVLQVVISDPA